MVTQLFIWFNRIANALGAILLAPIRWMPGWLSATLISVVTGVVMLIIFKYTSNQPAIKRTRDRIKANMLALSLFKDDLVVTLHCQGQLLRGAGQLLWQSLIPMVILTIPMILVLVLGQIALWYQARPLKVGEESIVTVWVKQEADDAVDRIELDNLDGAQVVIGPVRVPSKNMICWNVTPVKEGVHELRFKVAGDAFTKELVAGHTFQPTSLKRPSRKISDLLLHPREMPFDSDSVVQVIEVNYPNRKSWTSGTNNWVVYWFNRLHACRICGEAASQRQRLRQAILNPSRKRRALRIG